MRNKEDFLKVCDIVFSRSMLLHVRRAFYC